ncbi:hypothetical protein QL285_084296 [Trifolium repens]|nr:hypothetical protein QL285_084296 [Trifolium repens]
MATGRRTLPHHVPQPLRGMAGLFGRFSLLCCRGDSALAGRWSLIPFLALRLVPVGEGTRSDDVSVWESCLPAGGVNFFPELLSCGSVAPLPPYFSQERRESSRSLP